MLFSRYEVSADGLRVARSNLQGVQGPHRPVPRAIRHDAPGDDLRVARWRHVDVRGGAAGSNGDRRLQPRHHALGHATALRHAAATAGAARPLVLGATLNFLPCRLRGLLRNRLSPGSAKRRIPRSSLSICKSASKHSSLPSPFSSLLHASSLFPYFIFIFCMQIRLKTSTVKGWLEMSLVSCLLRLGL